MPLQVVGIDTETFMIDEEDNIPGLICCTICQGPNIDLYKHDDPELVKRLDSLLDVNNDLLLTAQKASFDFSVFALAFPQLIEKINEKYRAGQIICTMLYEKLLRLAHDGDIDRKEFNLEYLVAKYLGIDISEEKKQDTWRTSFNLLYDKPISEWDQEAVTYAKKDAMYPRDVFIKQLGVAKIKDVKRQSYCDWLGVIVTKIEGLKVDNVFLEERLKYFQGVIHSQDDILIKHNFKGPKSKSDPTLKKNTAVIKERVEACYKKLGVEPKKTDTGKTSCDAESLDAIQGMDEGIDALIALGSSGTAVNTFLLNWQGKDEIKPTLDMLKSTGRMSCIKPNLQNVNRDGRIRGCFVPRDGYYLCSIDYGQLELCTLAQTTYTMFKDLGQPCLMLEAINAGKDLHCITGASVLGTTYETMVKRLKDKNPIAKDFRQMAKAGNFGLPGGLGIDTFIQYAKTSYGVVVTRDQAKDIFSAFFNAFPEVRFYLDYMDNFKISKDIGTFYQCRQIGTDRVRMVPENQYCSACNTFFQGLASDGVKNAFVNLMNATIFSKEQKPLQSILKLIIHDEFLFEIPKEVAHEEAQVLSNIMIDSMKVFLPDVKIIKAEACLMERWEKQAEPVFENGKLVPWIYEKHGVK